MWIAQQDTEHFHFMAVGNTEEEARQAWLAGFRRHLASTFKARDEDDRESTINDWIEINHDGDPLEYYGVWTIELEAGQCACDGDQV